MTDIAQADTSQEERAEKIRELQDAIVDISCEAPEPEHTFTPGIYSRKLIIPAGMTVVGKTHKHEHLMIVLSGHSQVATDLGTTEVRGGEVYVSPPGAKRVVFALEDTSFLTIHHNPDNERDLVAIEDEHIHFEQLKLKSDEGELWLGQ